MKTRQKTKAVIAGEPTELRKRNGNSEPDIPGGANNLPQGGCLPFQCFFRNAIWALYSNFAAEQSVPDEVPDPYGM